VRCSQSNPSIVITLRSSRVLSWEEKKPAMYDDCWVLFRS